MGSGGWGHSGWPALAVATVSLLAFVAPASAQTERGSSRSAPPPSKSQPSAAPAAPAGIVAAFEDHAIDLGANWEQAQACLVLRQAGLVECFRTLHEAEDRAEALQPQLAAATYSCSSPLRLFEHSNYAGRQLLFFDRGYWQNLPDYGFNDQLSSYIVGACTTYLAESTNGGGAFYPGPRGAWSGVSWLAAGWDNRVSSLYMA
jgi:hypothetical protein